MMAMAVLLPGYGGVPDAQAVELTVVDLSWHMVLGRRGATEPVFFQGTQHDFRHRLIRMVMDRRLLERAVELARRTRDFHLRKFLDLHGLLLSRLLSRPSGMRRDSYRFKLIGALGSEVFCDL